jgi:predicted transcriptional regulator
MADATMTVRLSSDAESKLARLADHTKKSPAYLARQAITSFVESELAIIEGIQRGLADAEAGRVTPHDEAMRQLRETVKRAKSSE